MQAPDHLGSELLAPEESRGVVLIEILQTLEGRLARLRRELFQVLGLGVFDDRAEAATASASSFLVSWTLGEARAWLSCSIKLSSCTRASLSLAGIAQWIAARSSKLI